MRTIGAWASAAALVLAAAPVLAFDVIQQDAAGAEQDEVERLLGVARQGIDLDTAERYAEAEPLLREAHAALSVGAPIQNRWRLNVAISLAHTLQELNRRDEAIALLTEADSALRAGNQDAATDAPTVAVALAWMLFNADRFQEAGGMAERACRLLAMPEHGPDVARCARLDRIRTAAASPEVQQEQAAESRARQDFAVLTDSMERRDFATADAALGRLLAWLETTEGADGETTLTLRTVRARVLAELGRPTDARLEYLDAYSRQVQLLGAGHESAMDTLLSYGASTIADDHRAEVLALLDTAAPALVAAQGERSSLLARLHRQRGALLHEMARYVEAGAALDAAIAAAADLPPTDQDRVNPRVDQANLYLMTDRGRETIVLLESLIQEQRDLGAYDAPSTQNARMLLGEAYMIIQGRTDAAIALLEPLLEAWPAGERKWARNRAALLVELGMAHFQNGQVDQADQMIAEGAAMISEIAPRDMLVFRAQRIRGLILLRRGEVGAAADLLRATAQLEAEVLGDSHPEVATTLTGLAEVQQEQGALETARATSARAVSIAERTSGPLSLAAASAYNQAALLEWREEDWNASRGWAIKALAAYRAALGPDNPLTLDAETNVLVLSPLGDSSEEAEAAVQDLIDRHQRVFGVDHPELAGLYNVIAVGLRRHLSADNAESLLRRAVEIAEDRMSPNDPSRLLYERNLALELLDTGKGPEAMDRLRLVGRRMIGRSGDLEVETVGRTGADRARSLFRGLVAAAWITSEGG